MSTNLQQRSARPLGLFNRAFILIIRCYQVILSPVLGGQCRFTPTCSKYAIDALTKYPFFKACGLICLRLLKCHPFHPGGYNPA